MPRKYRPLARFEEHSLALFAALVMGSTGVAAQGQQQAAPMQEAAASAQVMTLQINDSAPMRGASSVDAAFTRADANGDNRLSREEAQRLPAVTERFDEIDTDHDRFLSREEFQRGVANQ